MEPMHLSGIGRGWRSWLAARTVPVPTSVLAPPNANRVGRQCIVTQHIWYASCSWLVPTGVIAIAGSLCPAHRSNHGIPLPCLVSPLTCLVKWSDQLVDSARLWLTILCAYSKIGGCFTYINLQVGAWVFSSSSFPQQYAPWRA